jgi:hypothetical protein
VLAVVLAAAGLSGCKRSVAEADLAGGPAIVVSSPDAPKWVRLLRAEGVAVRVGTLAEALDRRAAVVPSGADLVSSHREDLVRWVRSGGRLVTSHGALLQDLGFRRDDVRTVVGVEVESLGKATWPGPVEVRGLRSGGDLEETFDVARASGLSIQALSRLGHGRVLALAVDPVAGERAGHELLPWLGRQVVAATGAPPGPTRLGAEVYYDPGGLDGSPGEVAEILGDVRAVHVAGWNLDFNDPSQDFDYEGLISALHAKGVLVYAWLEPPFVSLRFWDDHPECRERTASGREAIVDWRRLAALEDSRCFTLAWDTWRRLLTRFDWDGVNVAELYFEPDIKAEDFTPFHRSALRRFKGDPVKDREAFLDFRTDLVVELNDAMLRNLNGLPNAAGLDFQLTVIDDRLDPELGRLVGSDVGRLAEVAQRNGASLQVEDPFTQWAEGPLRYDRLATEVATLLPGGQSFIDVNVVDRSGARPTAKMTGGELGLAAMAAGRSGRLALYSAGTIPTEDLDRLPGAMAGTAEVFDRGVKASWTVVVRAPGKAQRRLDVDGVAWPVASSGEALIPPGEHRLAWSAGPPRGPGLVRLTAEIGTASVEPDALTFRYDSRARPFAVVDRDITRVTVDGAELELEGAGRGAGRVVRLPAGNHEARIETAAAAG